jgi:hypothetical protein
MRRYLTYVFVLALFFVACGSPTTVIMPSRAHGKVFGKVQLPEAWWFTRTVVSNEFGDFIIVKVPMHRSAVFELDVKNGQKIEVFYTDKIFFDLVKEGDQIDCDCSRHRPAAETVTDSEVEKHGGQVE